MKATLTKQTDNNVVKFRVNSDRKYESKLSESHIDRALKEKKAKKFPVGKKLKNHCLVAKTYNS